MKIWHCKNEYIVIECDDSILWKMILLLKIIGNDLWFLKSNLTAATSITKEKKQENFAC